MTLTGLIFHPDIWLATTGYFVSAWALIWLTQKIAHYVEQISANHWYYRAFSHWCIEHIWIPLARVLALIAFITLAYPTLFGLDQTPGIITLLSTGNHFRVLVNAVFLTTIVLPLLPVIGNWHALILPLQGITAVSLTFSWLLPYYSLPEISFIPAFKTIIAMGILAYISHWAAKWIAEHLGKALDESFNRQGYDVLVYQLALVLLQTPIILSYSLYLGGQLPVL